MRFLTRLSWFFIMIGSLLVAGVAGIHYVRNHPEALTKVIVYFVDKSTGGAVQVESVVRVELADRISVHLSGVKVGKKTDPIRINVDEVSLVLSSIREWLRLKPGFREVVLDHPEMVVSIDRMIKGSRQKSGLQVPVDMLRVSDGKVAVEGLPEDFPVILWNGIWHRRLGSVSGEWAGGRFKGEMRTSGPSLRLFRLSLTGVDLSALSSRASGSADGELTLEIGEEFYQWNAFFKTAENSLIAEKWRAGGLSLRADGRFADKLLQADNLILSHPVGKVTGKLTYAAGETGFGMDKGILSLSLSTRSLSYESLVGLVPEEMLPEWFQKLFFEQIRKGTVHLSQCRYQGTLADLTDPKQLIQNLELTLDGKNALFRIPDSPEAVQVDSAQVRMEGGNLIVGPVSGHLGTSPIDEVSIRLIRFMDPGLRLELDASLDMPLDDFLRAWRICVEPWYIHHLLAPMQDPAPGGRIFGQIRTQYVKQDQNRTFEYQGNIWLDGCSFTWNGTPMEAVNGDIRIPGWEAPAIVSWTGIFGDLPPATLNLTAARTGNGLTYRFDIETDRFPNSVPVHLDPQALVRLQGSGEGNRYAGDLQVLAGSLSASGVELFPRDGLIVGMGHFAGSLDQSVPIELSSAYLDTGDGVIALSLGVENQKGVFTLSGNSVGAAGISVPGIGGRSTAGTLGGEFRLTWDDAGMHTVAGLSLENVIWNVAGGEDLELSGRIRFRDQLLQSRIFRVRSGQLTADIAGVLDLTGNWPAFKGFLLLDGLRLNGGEGGSTLPGWLGRVTADAELELKQAFFHHVPVDHAAGHVLLDSGRLSIDRLQSRGVGGSCAVSGTIDLEGADKGVDLKISYSGDEIQELMRCLSDPESCRSEIPAGKSLLDGRMTLDGTLNGPSDELSGQFDFRAEKGRIWKYALLSKIFGVLNLYKFINTAEVDFVEEGFPYNSMTGTFKLKDNRIIFDDFRLDSNSLQLSAVGSFDLIAGELDAVAGVQLFETLDRTIGMIPVIGWILTGDERKLSVISLSIKGDIRAPSIQLMPGETVSRPLRESLLRLLRLPGNLITDFTSSTKTAPKPEVPKNK